MRSDRTASALLALSPGRALRPRLALPRAAALALAIGAGACGNAEKKHCKVNDQCFACPDDKAFAACKRDPTSSRCKWTPMENCAGLK